jgi:hypothetical protein
MTTIMATKAITPEEFVDALPSWSVLDVINAVKLMEEKLGIKAAAAVAAAPCRRRRRRGCGPRGADRVHRSPDRHR